MKLAHFDAYSGIAGDMTVGALLDAGADAETLVESLRGVGTGADFRVEKTKRKGIAGTKFHVLPPEAGKPHRHLHHIQELIDRSPLPGPVQQTAQRIFQALGEAEAAVHGVEIRKVHFHEVGAIDSICDIVGAALGLYLLEIERVYCSPVNVGSGTAKTDHGILPVPTPATAKLLFNKPIYSRGPQFELTTPTGAAIVAAMAERVGPMPPMLVSAVGFGAGDNDFPEQANLLRVLVGNDSRAPEATAVTVLEANIDDATPQVLGYTLERLMAAGALDASLETILMKKNRPGQLLRVIADPADRDRLAAIVFAETPTLGIRVMTADRLVLAREMKTADTPWGAVAVKIAGGQAAPEYDDCRRLAMEKGVPLRDVIAAALRNV